MAISENQPATVAVIILTLNQRETTLQCLATLAPMIAPSVQILLWDNGSEDGTVAAVHDALPSVLVHHHATNLGVASGRNAAAALAMETWQPAYLLFLDNDMLCTPNFVDALLAPLRQDEKVGQTQAKLRFMHDRTRLNDGGGAKIDFRLWQITPVGYNEIDQGQYDVNKPCIACGGAMMVRTTLFQQLGGFDTLFDPFGPEDIDFSLRLHKVGYHALYAPQALAYHTVSHTFGRGYNAEYARLKARHWYQFMRRHASVRQQLCFFLLGAPYLALQVALREGRRGTLRALLGLLRGLLDFHKQSPLSNK
jgi:GT2 family glycosyltransferase